MSRPNDNEKLPLSQSRNRKIQGLAGIESAAAYDAYFMAGVIGRLLDFMDEHTDSKSRPAINMKEWPAEARLQASLLASEVVAGKHAPLVEIGDDTYALIKHASATLRGLLRAIRESSRYAQDQQRAATDLKVRGLVILQGEE